MPLNSHMPKFVITKNRTELAIAAAPTRSGETAPEAQPADQHDQRYGE